MKAAIFFLLSVLALAKPNTLQGFNQKRATATASADSVAASLATSLYSTVHHKYRKGQFAALYLHPKSAKDALDYQNSDVKNVLSPGSRLPLTLTEKQSIWPQTPSNLVVAIPIKEMFADLGHSENRVLKKLDEMMSFFKSKNAPDSCPSYVIIVSKLAPCYTVPKGAAAPYGCTKQIIGKAQNLRLKCPHTTFVVGYSILQAEYEKNWKMAEKLLTKEGIIIVRV